jgi:hypothetical protein
MLRSGSGHALDDVAFAEVSHVHRRALGLAHAAWPELLDVRLREGLLEGRVVARQDLVVEEIRRHRSATYRTWLGSRLRCGSGMVGVTLRRDGAALL